MATDNEINQMYDALVSALRGLRLDWVIEEVEAQVALGRLSVKKVRPAEFKARFEDRHNQENYVNKPKGQSLKFVVSEEYTPRERLMILLDAVESAVVQTVEVARYITLNDNIEIQGLQNIEFFSEQTGQSFRINPTQVLLYDESVKKLARLLGQLRQRV